MQRSEQWEESQPDGSVSPLGLTGSNAVVFSFDSVMALRRRGKAGKITHLRAEKKSTEKKNPRKDLRTCGASVLRSFLSDWQLDWQFADFH